MVNVINSMTEKLQRYKSYVLKPKTALTYNLSDSNPEFKEDGNINIWYQSFLDTNKKIIVNNPNIALTDKYMNTLKNIQYDREIRGDKIIHIFPSIGLKVVIPEFDQNNLKHSDADYDGHRSLNNLTYNEIYKNWNKDNLVNLGNTSQEEIVNNFLKLINYISEQFNFETYIDEKFLDRSAHIKMPPDTSAYIARNLTVGLSVITGQKYSMPYKFDDTSSSSLFCDLARCPTLSNINNKINGILCPIFFVD